MAGIAAMHERSNGLGGGFAGYGIYPEYRELYAFHVFYDTADGPGTRPRRGCCRHFDVDKQRHAAHARPLRPSRDAPSLMRYFAAPKPQTLLDCQAGRTGVRGAVRHAGQHGRSAAHMCFPAAKIWAYSRPWVIPEDVGEFYRLEEYEGYAWTAHGRYPTNTPGWWGGAHPFAMLDYSVVHNGEISSYDANRRFIEMYGYKCTLLTDTEVITYIIDFLLRQARA